ncbi:hypothetical protein [Nonomuraea sp. NPDC003201]
MLRLDAVGQAQAVKDGRVSPRELAEAGGVRVHAQPLRPGGSAVAVAAGREDLPVRVAAQIERARPFEHAALR